MSKTCRHFDSDYMNNSQVRRPEVGDWKKQAQEELNMASVFIIINEWDGEAGSGSEVTGGVYFASESEAWDALKLIADELHHDLPKDHTSIAIIPSDDEYESYYIEELLKSNA